MNSFFPVLPGGENAKRTRTRRLAPPRSSESDHANPARGIAAAVRDSIGWARDWLVELCRLAGCEPDTVQTKAIADALESVARTSNSEQRTLSVLRGLLQDRDIKEALSVYTASGMFGALLDADHDTLNHADWQAFEMEGGRVYPGVGSRDVELYELPAEHRLRLRTNNPLERVMKEIKRRTNVVGSFPDGRSALMLSAARLRHVAGTKWGTRKYLDIQRLYEFEREREAEKEMSVAM